MKEFVKECLEETKGDNGVIVLEILYGLISLHFLQSKMLKWSNKKHHSKHEIVNFYRHNIDFFLLHATQIVTKDFFRKRLLITEK